MTSLVWALQLRFFSGTPVAAVAAKVRDHFFAAGWMKADAPEWVKIPPLETLARKAQKQAEWEFISIW